MSPARTAMRARPVGGSRPATGSAPRRADLRVVRERRRTKSRVVEIAAGLIVLSALLAVVIGHSMLAQGQVRLTTIEAQSATEQAIHRQLLAEVAKGEDPAAIISKAKALGLVTPPSVTQLPAVPLDSPIGGAATTTTTLPRSAASGASKRVSGGR
ncbi:MAG: hypothetical protein ACRDVP_05615 [Acidimicrobiales bacterium]